MSNAPKASCGGETSSSLLDLNTSPLPSEVETFDHTIFFAESAEESEDAPEEASYVAEFKAKIEMRSVPGFENDSGMSNSSVHSHSSPLAGSGLMTRQFFPLKEASSESAVTRPHHPFSFQYRDSGAPLNDPKLCDGDLLSSSIPLQTARRSRRGPRSKSSQFKGVTFYKRTGRWESHIWDCGKQVYLGGFDTAQAAARAYDRAALRFRGPDAEINFHILDYEEDLNQISHLNKEEVIQILRRQRTGLSGGRPKYTGVTLHNRRRWEVQFLEKRAYDRDAIRCHGSETETNFDRRIYASVNRVESALDLKIGGASCSSTTMNIGAPPDDRLQGAWKSFDANINNKDLEPTGEKCEYESSVMLLQRHSRNHEWSLPVEASVGTVRCSHAIQVFSVQKRLLKENDVACGSGSGFGFTSPLPSMRIPPPNLPFTVSSNHGRAHD